MMELGATCSADGSGGTRFAVWSTNAREVGVRFFADRERRVRDEALTARGDGLFSDTFSDVATGALYKFVLDGEEVPDPYARFLPFGVDGPARVEAKRARTAEPAFQPPPFERWVIYEIHVGTFTTEGTWAAARARLDDLVELGVNAVELMPIAAFAGARGWGYDGVALFAPFAPYGEPSDLHAFVAACHARSIAVILDVVYNHFGPAGNYLRAYSPEYFTPKHRTAWGDAPDYAEPHLRALVLGNARYWLDEFEVDALRLDATHAILDDSSTHILSDLARVAADFAPRRYLIAEDERNDPAILVENKLDAVWADDFHHVVHVLFTRERDGYYGAYAPTVAELARTIERGWRYEGEVYPPWKKSRGRAASQLLASNFIYAIQNHDQIGNRPFGNRFGQCTGVEEQAAAAMLLLFLPMIPLLFMGEEWAASSPFFYFTDHAPELGALITKGRHEEFAHFDGFSDPSSREHIPDPQSLDTFARSRLNWEERREPSHAQILALYRRLLSLRASDPVLSAPSRDRMTCEVHGGLLVVRRWLGSEERALLFNPDRVSARAPAPWAPDDVLVASAGTARADEVPARSALLLLRRR